MNEVKLGSFLVDLQAGTLKKDQQTNKLEPQVLAFLHVLIKRPGQLIDRESLLQEVWHNRQVSDDAMRAVVRKLRDALQDDARNPIYIQTVPLKGYRLIASVKPVHHHTLTKAWLAAAAGVIVIAGLISYSIFSVSEHPAAPQVQYLTKMAGSEMLADFHEGKQALLFSHRFDNPDPLQMYAKNLQSGQVKRLTWSNEGLKYGFWSPSGEQVAYTLISDELQRYFIADFDFEKGLQSPRELDIQSSNKNLLGWSADGLSMYFSDPYRKDVAKGLYQLNLQQNRLIGLTKPSVAGTGDFFAKESPDGKRLAVLRSVDANRIELIVFALDENQKIVSNRVLPMMANRLAWHPDNKRLMLSGFTGDLRQYDVVEDAFSVIQGLNPNTNDILHLCAENCMMLREHNGNFLDIQEQPNPFSSARVADTEYVDLPSADDFPFYGPDGMMIYFTSLTENALLLQRQNRLGEREQIAQFDHQERIENLSINGIGERIVGQRNKRIFVLDLRSGEMNYLSTDLEDASNPSWANDNQHVFFSKLENGVPVIYKVNVHSFKQGKIADGYLGYREGENGRVFAVNADLELVELEGVLVGRKFTRLKHSAINQWRLFGNNIYIMQRSGNTAAELVRLDVDSGMQDKRIIAPHRFRLNFDLHPTGKTLLIVKSLIAQSNIVKVTH